MDQELTIQLSNAINAAQNGDEVVICDGNYYENIVINNKQNLTIRSYSNDKTKVTISNQNNGQPTINFSNNYSSNIIFKNLTIINDSPNIQNAISTSISIGKVIIENCNIESLNGTGIYYINNSDGGIILKNINIKTGNYGVYIKGSTNGVTQLDNTTITSNQTAIFFNSSLNNGISINNVSIESTNYNGIMFNSNISGTANFENISIKSRLTSLHFNGTVNNELTIKNVNLNSTDIHGIYFKQLHGNIIMDNMNINSKNSSIKFDSGVSNGFTVKNSFLVSTNESGININSNNLYGTLYFDNITIQSQQQAIFTGGTINSNISITNSIFKSRSNDAVRLNVESWYNFSSTGSEYWTYTDGKYGLYLNLPYSNNVQIINNCFFAKNPNYHAWSAKSGYNWNGNYWDQVIGAYIMNNINDLIPLSTCNNIGIKTCFFDDFNRNGLGTNWSIIKNQNFNPTVDGDKLFITDNLQNIATGITLAGNFPANDNFIEVEFNHFAYPNINGADGIAIVFSDADINPIAGGYGGSLGYAQRCGVNGFAGGWIGVGLDEYGNFSNPTECRDGGVGFRKDSIAIRGRGSGTTGYKYLTGTNSLTPGIDSNINNGPNYKYKISIDTRDNKTFIKVDRDTTGTGNIYTNLIPWTDITQDATPPVNFKFSITGGTGSVSNYHKLDNLRLKAIKCGTIPGQSNVDHYEIVHDGSGLTCQPENITIKACQDSSCTQLYNSTTSLTLNKDGTNIGSYTFTGNTTAVVSHNTPGTITLSLSNMNPTPQNGYKCLNTSTGSNSCEITFYDSGFVFDIKDTYSCKDQNVTISAVKKDDQTQTCIPAFQNKTLPINFTFTYLNPSSNPANTKPIISAASEAQLPSTVNLNFNNNGSASFNFQYPDSGQISITASFDNGTTHLEGTDNAIFYPYGFYVYTTNPNWEAETGANSSVFKKAGELFNLSARAVCWEADTDTDLSNNTITKNYQKTDVSVTHSLIEPSGGNAGNISISSLNFINGQASTINQTYSEVGIIKFSVKDSNYFGYTISGTSKNIGRFVPDKFVLDSKGIVKNQCNNFTYFGYDNLTIDNVTIRAVNTDNQTTKNYKDDFTKFDPSKYDNYNFSTIPNTLTLNKGANSVKGSWDNGILRFTASFKFEKPSIQTKPQYPVIYTKIIDSDSITMDNASINDNNTIELRYGILDIQNAYGPTNYNLSVPAYIIYFDSNSKWSITNDDTCTIFNIDNITLSDYTDNLTTGETAILSISKKSNGEYLINLKAPGQGNEGSVKLKLSGLDYLNNTNSTSNQPLSEGTATFGIYGNQQKRLYWKEVPAR